LILPGEDSGSYQLASPIYGAKIGMFFQPGDRKPAFIFQKNLYQFFTHTSVNKLWIRLNFGPKQWIKLWIVSISVRTWCITCSLTD